MQLTLIAITWGGVKAGSCCQHCLSKDLTAIDAPRQLREGITLKTAHHGARWEAFSVPADAVEPGTSLQIALFRVPKLKRTKRQRPGDPSQRLFVR